MFFYESEKNMIFMFFYLQINVFNIYGLYVVSIVWDVRPSNHIGLDCI